MKTTDLLVILRYFRHSVRIGIGKKTRAGEIQVSLSLSTSCSLVTTRIWASVRQLEFVYNKALTEIATRKFFRMGPKHPLLDALKSSCHGTKFWA